MTIVTVEGTYRDGKIELSEHPESIGATARVLVTFLPEPAAPEKPDPGGDVDRAELRKQAIAEMRQGFHLGGPPYTTREELYDRIP